MLGTIPLLYFLTLESIGFIFTEDEDLAVTNEFVRHVEYIPIINYLYCLACFQRPHNRQNKSGKSDLQRKEEKASLLGWEAGWSECCSANVPRVKSTNRVIGLSRGRKGNRKYWTTDANPEDCPLGLGRLGLPDRLPFSDCQVKAILQVDAILPLDLATYIPSHHGECRFDRL